MWIAIAIVKKMKEMKKTNNFSKKQLIQKIFLSGVYIKAHVKEYSAWFFQFLHS